MFMKQENGRNREKKMFKRIFTFVLVVSIMFGMMPLAGPKSYAAGESLKVQSRSTGTAGTTNSIGFAVRIVNTGASTIDLSDLTIRYYYTIDGDKAQSFWCDWASCGSSVVNGSFCNMISPASNARSRPH